MSQSPPTEWTPSKKLAWKRMQFLSQQQQISCTSQQIPYTSQQISCPSKQIPCTSLQISYMSQIPDTSQQIPCLSHQGPCTLQRTPSLVQQQIPCTSLQIPFSSPEIQRSSQQNQYFPQQTQCSISPNINKNNSSGQKSSEHEGYRLEIPHLTKTYLVGSFPPILHPIVPPHTLILGTMPSLSSHGQGEYYAHPSNVFWWIVGEALGFRRGGSHNKRDWPDQFHSRPAKDILEGIQLRDAPVLKYKEQVSTLTRSGYGLWDVVKQCQIRNSDDASIRDQVPNNIRDLICKVPSIRRIVFSSGKTSAKLFLSLHKSWLKEPGQFHLGGGEHTASVFGKAISAVHHPIAGGLELVVPPSVSPAAASIRFPGKREEWLNVVFNKKY